MLRIPVNQLKPGMVLARSIRMPNDPRMVLLQARREIPMTIVPRLKKMGIFSVWVANPNTEFLEDVVDEGLGELQHDVYVQFRAYYEAAERTADFTIDFGMFDQCVQGFAKYLRSNRNCQVFLEKLDAFDNYLLSHSTNVCYLSLLLGLHLDRYLIKQRPMKSPGEAKDVHYLGLGSLLHDVGKMQIPKAVLEKPGKLTDEERELIETHPLLGYEMVRNRIPTIAAQVVLNHHQRWDGMGYPTRAQMMGSEGDTKGLAGNQIHVFARIAAIADVYDALTTERSYCEALTPVEALAVIESREQGHFDPEIKQGLFEITPAFPLGQLVQVSNGYEAVVTGFNPKTITRPKVQYIRTPSGMEIDGSSVEEIDLSEYDDLSIVAVNGRDVANAVRILEDSLATKRELAGV